MRGSGKSGWLLGIVLLTALMAPISVQAQGATAAQYLAAGQQMFGAKNYAQAAQYYNAATKLDPNNVAAYQGIGNCYYMLGQKSNALAYYQKALSLQPGNAQLAQFVQNLQAQVGGGGGTPGGAASADPLSQGTSLFQQKQYAAAIPYFGRAIQQNPNDYRAYYYAGYTYYMMGQAKYAAFYFAVANLKQPNASIQAYADRVKANLPPADQQWVSDSVAKYGGGAGGGGGSKGGIQFGFHVLGGSAYIFADPSQIINGVKAGQVTTGGSLNGTTPNMIALAGFQPYLQFGDSFEFDFGAAYIPVGNLSYTWLAPGMGQGFQDTFNSSLVEANLGLKVLFGDSSMKTYIGLGGIVAPVSTVFTKVPVDPVTGALTGAPQDPSSGTYSSLAIGGYMQLGMDFYLSKGLAIGPFVGVQVLTATNFQGAGNTLYVDQNTGDVTGASTAGATSTALTMDFSNVNYGVNLTFGF
jgi:tetratricopeptide (TPR) repeat protein